VLCGGGSRRAAKVLTTTSMSAQEDFDVIANSAVAAMSIYRLIGAHGESTRHHLYVLIVRHEGYKKCT